MSQNLILSGKIEERIFSIRGKRVMLDSDLAKLYGVTTGNLNKAVKRNRERFPADFMVTLTSEERTSLRFHFGSLKRGAHSKYLPLVFTEQGVAMLSGVLKSKRAVYVNIAIMRAFVKLRELMMTHKDLARRIEALEKQYQKHDERFHVVFDAIKKLLQQSSEENKNRMPIGFHPHRERTGHDKL